MIVYPIAFIKTFTFDPDAENFINVASITNSTEQNAINTLVLTLKSNSLWSNKMFAIYPFVGGTSTSCSYNLIDPTKYQITWSGGVTFNVSGVTGNGTNGFGDTQFNPNVVNATTGITTSFSYSIYSRSQFGSNGIELGNAGNNGVSSMAIYAGRTGGGPFTHLVDNYSNTRGRYFWNTSITTGLFGCSRTAINSMSPYKDGSLISTVTTSELTANITDMNRTCYLLAYNFSTPGGYSLRQLAFSHIGLGLSSTDMSNLYNAQQTFQTTLGRQV